MRSVVFDLETGGLLLDSPILQIAAVAVDEGWDEITSFEQKVIVDPSKCDPAALKINHWDEDVWKAEGLPLSTALTRFSNFTHRFADIPVVSKAGRTYHVTQLVGYNSAVFDMPMIRQAFDIEGIFLGAHPRCLDVLQLVMWYFHFQRDWQQKLTLKMAASLLGFRPEESELHSALYDVRTTIKIVKEIHRRFSWQGDE